MGFLLFIIATILKLTLFPLLYLIGAITSIVKGGFNQWNLDLAIAKDQYGNALGKYVWNGLLITKHSKHLFGNIDETISSVIGKNKRDRTLTFLGIFVENILEAIDPNHSENAIDETENDISGNNPDAWIKSKIK
ncbi:MAG: hypothetical protein WCJ62_11645 [Flavobacterium sp.]